MKKKTALLITLIFCLFFGGIALGSLIAPDRTFSEQENRNLQQAPRLTLSGLTSGDYMDKAEKYVSDQLLFRDGWVRLQAWSERLLGKKENNDVYFGSDDTLIKKVSEPDEDQMERDISYLNTLVSQTDVPVYFGLIPTAACVWSDRLPAGAPTADEAAWIEKLYAETDARTIDILSVLRDHASEDIYYRTDHHWTSLGAGCGAEAITEAMGLETIGPEDYEKTTVARDFYGTSYSASGASWTAPDSIDIYVPEEGVTGEGLVDGLYDWEKLSVKDKYSFFLGGNQPLCVLRSESDGPRLLLIRDSYSDSLAPFLTERFSEIHLIDLRYYTGSVSDYIRENNIDDVLILYGFSTYIDDTNQFLLAN